MSGHYTSNDSLLNDTFWVVLLSQRDVSGHVPINYVTQPTVSLSAVCFGDKKYDSESASTCISNLLTVGYRRLIVDLYWSADTQRWQFCPVTVPSSSSGTTDSLQELGPYTCSNSFDIITMRGILKEYLQDTQEAVMAQMIYVIFNIHSAAGASTPDQPAPVLSSANLPSGSQLLGSMINSALGTYVYGPTQLSQERSNLNTSWYHDISSQPLAGYFLTETAPNGIQSTTNGWPSGYYLSTVLNRRLLLGWGSIDPQMQDYDFSGDSAYIFPAADITFDVTVTPTSDRTGLQSGCFFEPAVTDASEIDSSWAESSGLNMNSDVGTGVLGNASLLLQNLTSCGISPVINQTLSGLTADANVDAYRNLSMSSTWSWAVGEPQNLTMLSYDQNYNNTSELFRCALMDITVSGHWRAGNCSEKYLTACRVQNSPYSWVLSSDKQSFSEAPEACPEKTRFDVPHTGLENTYLYHSALSSLRETNETRVWLNFNSLDAQYCWILGGSNATCSYVPNADDVQRKTIIVPTIAAIIILIITALTIFVKCNANRRTSRRRKRVIEGWEYEGVPS